MVPMVDFALVVAGSEASGGAGIQADLKTFQQLGVHGSGALTCIVSFDPKNDWGHRVVPVDAPVIADQQFIQQVRRHQARVASIERARQGLPAPRRRRYLHIHRSPPRITA